MIGCNIPDTAIASPDGPTAKLRRAFVLLVATASLTIALPAKCATVYEQAVSALPNATTISSNAVADPEGSDRDVTAYDNFTLSKPASIKSVRWRGSSSNAGLAGFTVRIFASSHDAAAHLDLSAPLATINVRGKAGEHMQGNKLSDFSADFEQPLALAAGVQYWISIVSVRNDPSPWGWANGTGGDGKSIQSFSEFKILPASGDRAFSLKDGQ